MTPRIPVGLRAMLFAAGHEHRRAPERYEWDGQRRGSAEFGLLQITLAGRGQLEFEGTVHTLTPGTALALWFPHPHRYLRPRGHDWRFIYVCLHGSEALRLWRQAITHGGPVWPIQIHQPLFKTAVEICRSAQANQLDDAYHVSQLAYRLALKGLEHVVGRAASDPAARSPVIQSAIELIRERYAQPLTVDDLAAAAGLSRFHFSRVFRQSEGVSPGAWLRRHRLAVAVRLLQTTTDPIKAIAQATGFCDASHLTKAVRSAYNTTPAALRQQGMYGYKPSSEASRMRPKP